MSAEEQFRIYKLQVFNWGTFSGVHDIPIAERGFLFVGRSGAGKTTLLDAFSTLLIPPRWVNFNAAAREGERGSRDRSLLSYVRGAWAEQQDENSGMIATRHLRTGTTWSGLALSYRNTSGQVIVLLQLFWIRGKANNAKDLRRYFLIFERPFDLRDLSDFDMDVRRLKSKFPDAFAREDFTPYAERFRRRLGIDNELALKLLHKTQSAKNLGDLNAFLRDFMLDEPETFAAADRLVAEFAELNEAHQAVITAREQVRTLAPAREDYDSLQTCVARTRDLAELRAGVDVYKNNMRAGLIGKRILEIEAETRGKRAEEQAGRETLENDRAALDDLRRQHRDAGGGQVEQLQSEQRRTEELRDARLRKRDDAQSACRKLGWQLANSPSEFADLTTAAAREVEKWPRLQEEAREKYSRLYSELAGLTKEFAAAREEAESLRRQPSNVPFAKLKIRGEITSELGLAEGALPFAAELIEVIPREEEWRGAIERVLGGFALSLIVEDRHYVAVSDLVNRMVVNDRLTYNRVGREGFTPARRLQSNSLFNKVQVKDGPFRAYIEYALTQRFDYACVESMQAFRNSERAVTRQGQMRHSKERHEKDDRRDINERSRWVLGFDNRAKLALFEQKAVEKARAVDDCNRGIREHKQAEDLRAARALICQTLSNIQWQEMDAAPLLERLAAIGETLKDLLEGSTTLRQLDRRIRAQEATVRKSEETRIGLKAQLDRLEKDMREFRLKLDSLRERLKSATVTELQSTELPRYFTRLNQALTIETLDAVAHDVDRALGEEQKTQAEIRNRLTNAIEKRFSEFQRRWPVDAGDLDGTLSSAPDYFAKLKRLETDRLPDYEQRFFDLLRNQSHQNLAALSTHISQARKTIFDRLELVNQSLSSAAFDRGTHLHIDASDRNLDEVRQFRVEIQQALSHAWTDDREQAEVRFVVLRGLVERLGSQETEQKRWRSLVLDVRQHVEFIGREIDSHGKEVEVYRGGSGKSGGQRQKLATTCLAAALRYQLGGDDHGVPRYAPVVLDEAFDKADNEFTALAMNIFAEFGFQMIVATPLKSVMTLEPFIGGACFVDIAERRHSGVLMIEYDSDRQRLKLPERSRDEAGAAVS